MPSSFPSPEYLHVLLNHVPLTGLIVASLGLLLSLLMRSASAQVCALVLVLVCAASAWPVYATGKGAYRHIRRIADEAGMDYLDEHLDRADHFTLVYLPAVLSALAGLIIPRFRHAARVPLAWATLGCTVAAIAAGLYISEAGGKVRHPEFRTGPPASLM